MEGRLGEHTLITAGEGLQGWIRGLVVSGLGEVDRGALFEQLEAVLGPVPLRIATPEELLADRAPEEDELLVLVASDAAGELLYALRHRKVGAPALLVVDPERAEGFVERPEEIDLSVLGAVGLLPLTPTRFETGLALAVLRIAHRREVELLETYAELNALYLDLHRVRREVEGLSITAAGSEIDRVLEGDERTARILATLERRLERSRSWRLPLACFAIGIVGVGELRDQDPALGGHVRVQVAFRLRQALRRTDRVWRWSDDEMLLLSDGDTIERLQSQARRLREAVEAEPLARVAGSLGVAIGVARSSEEEEPAEDLVQRALGALRDARRRGRSRISVV